MKKNMKKHNSKKTTKSVTKSHIQPSETTKESVPPSVNPPNSSTSTGSVPENSNDKTPKVIVTNLAYKMRRVLDKIDLCPEISKQSIIKSCVHIQNSSKSDMNYVKDLLRRTSTLNPGVLNYPTHWSNKPFDDEKGLRMCQTLLKEDNIYLSHIGSMVVILGHSQDVFDCIERYMGICALIDAAESTSVDIYRKKKKADLSKENIQQ